MSDKKKNSPVKFPVVVVAILDENVRSMGKIYLDIMGKIHKRSYIAAIIWFKRGASIGCKKEEHKPI